MSLNRWPFRLYLHGVELPRIDSKDTIDLWPDCARAQGRPLANLIREVDEVVLGIDARVSLDEVRKDSMRDAVTDLAARLSRLVPSSGAAPWPDLWLLITAGEPVLARVSPLAADLGRLPRWPDEQRSSVLAGYLLSGLRLDETLAPLLDLPWQRVNCAIQTTRHGQDPGMWAWSNGLSQRMRELLPYPGRWNDD